MILPPLNLSKEECDGALRRLELETYSNLISVFRAQGCLNNEKYKILGDMRRLLFIPDERHRAEARRAANDEQLSTIANSIFGPNSQLEWLKEGKRKFPLLNRKAPLTSLAKIANSAAKFSWNKKSQLHIKKIGEKKTVSSEEKLDEKNIKQESNKCTNLSDIHLNKNIDILRNLYSADKNLSLKHENNTIENTVPTNKTLNISLSCNEINPDLHKNMKVESLEVKKTDTKLNSQYEINKNSTSTTKTTILEKPNIIVINNDIPKNTNLVGNILNIKRQSSEKISEIADVPQKKFIKAELIKEPSDLKNLNIPIIEPIGQTKINTNQSAVAIQKIINPFVIENIKVPPNRIQLKDIQSRKTVKLITAPNGKIFIQPAQGNTNRMTNIRPIPVIKPNQRIAITKVTKIGNVSDMPKSVKIIGDQLSKNSLILLPNKKPTNQHIDLTDKIDFTKKHKTIPTKFSIQPTASSLNPLIKTTTNDQSHNHVGNQGNVFVIGSVINQGIVAGESNKDNINNVDNNIHGKDSLVNLITEDTPVDIIPSPLEEIYKPEQVKIISTTTINNKQNFDISKTNTSIIDNEPQNLNVYSTTDWELELDQEAAQRNKERSNSDEDNFNTIIEEIVEEVTEDSYTEYEDSCHYYETNNL